MPTVPAVVVPLAGAAMTSPDAFHAELARALGLPAFYGANLDALIDCLSWVDDPDTGAGMTAVTVPPGGVLVLAVRDADAVPAPLHAGLADAIAFVNHRRSAAGAPPVVALMSDRSAP